MALIFNPMSKRRIEELMKNLRSYCDEHWGAQTKLADHLGTTPQLVHSWVSGVRVPSAENALAIRDWLESKKR